MRGPRVTLEQWRTLQAVIDHGGYAQAAEALHKSQSSISYTVGKLQEQLGMELLHIEGRKAVLTSAGEALLQRSRHLIEHAMELEAVAASLEQGWEAEVRLAMDAIFPKSILINAFKDFLPKSSNTKVVLREEVLSGAAEALLEKKVELSITPVVPPGFMGEKLMDIQFIAVAHPDHELQKLGRPVTMKDLESQMHIVIKDSAIKQNRDSGWLGSDLRWTVSNFESARALLASGLGFSWLPTHEACDLINEGNVKPLELDTDYRKQGSLYLVYASKEIAGPATNLLADCIQTCTKAYEATHPALEELMAK
ncbi:LysR family transcriptional regulator [Bermanella marisrubri]|uniref:Transcriptional Regulator, LysR family protein n=1 Tax=Bermanella marisrubri TaxID=207949 RepID=Q1N5A9_9GAMM|nr:LysR family transcriptional regulator [Bermanella marisrubri]EAT13156.1 Transcriptional Regulator, LysR family protein [Oceanobacter sp. RED65] [Bermanella marisrubri]QIZ83930.1 LysR family transcriptional regulator [Bermanella marisrubri]